MTDNNLKSWDIHWDVMNVMIGGQSAIDLERIHVADLHDAKKFVQHYGYDLDKANDAQDLHAIFIEAMHFIANHLMPIEWKKGKRPPQDLIQPYSMNQLMLWAANHEPKYQHYQAWACAILRVMHTISHIDGVHRSVDISSAKSAIMSRIEPYIFNDSSGQLRLGTQDHNVALYKIDWKLHKPRDSIIMKLLHKKNNVAETIFDLLGLRIVTKNLTDVVLAVKLLRDFYMITFPNCNPGRSRNSLIDIGHLRSHLDILKRMHQNSHINDQEFSELLERMITPSTNNPSTARHNPHSADNYRSIQLTCRQMVPCQSGSSVWLQKLRQELIQNNHIDHETSKLIATLIKSHNHYQEAYPTIHHAYFPFEVHVLDQNSYQTNASGKASHARYKGSQVRAARRRVLAKVLTLKKSK